MSTGAVIARLSGDEFGMIIDGPQPAAGLALADKINEALSKEFFIDGKAHHIGVTCGIAVFPRDGETPAALMANADAALHRAKSEARGSTRVFDATMDQQIRDRRALNRDLGDAIKAGQLELHYQPQAVMPHRIVGFEALLRWNHPTRGFIPPSLFIPIAEESSLIVEMGDWVLREACREAASWPNQLQVAVNLSPIQFLHGDLVGRVHEILFETGLAPSRLELEITEGVLIRDFERGLSLLRRLKALGVLIAMDDFGSGYSSLSYLQSFPFDKIKIDRAFITNLGRNPQSAAIVRAVIGLGHGLHVPIVAEGVETQDQLKFLIEESCDQVQGYFIGKPAPIATYNDVVGRKTALRAVSTFPVHRHDRSARHGISGRGEIGNRARDLRRLGPRRKIRLGHGAAVRRCVDGRWRDGVDQDAVGRHLLRQPRRKGRQGGFGGRVGGHSGAKPPFQRLARNHIDDPAAAATSHAGDCRPTAQRRSHEVGFDLGEQGAFAGLRDR